MFVRKVNSDLPPNIILLLLKQLQPNLSSTINDVELVENMLRVEFEKGELNLLFWVKTLPVKYYHAILNTITPDNFKRWYQHVFSYKKEYAMLTEEQQNEWELALFYFRDKFSTAFIPSSFAEILRVKKEKDIDVLAWRLKRQPALPLNVLAKLACLNYPAVQAYANKHIPDAAERVAFARQCAIFEADVLHTLFRDLGPLQAQYDDWCHRLTSNSMFGGFLGIFHSKTSAPLIEPLPIYYNPMRIGPL